jgi:hypothetical protein
MGKDVHHGTLVAIGWFQVQFDEIMDGCRDTLMLVTNEGDDPPQLKLNDVVCSSLVWKGGFL